MNKILVAIQIILIVFLAGCGEKSEYVGDLKNELPDGKGIMNYEDGSTSVSYTHLTLPTIYSV